VTPDPPPRRPARPIWATRRRYRGSWISRPLSSVNWFDRCKPGSTTPRFRTLRQSGAGGRIPRHGYRQSGANGRAQLHNAGLNSRRGLDRQANRAEGRSGEGEHRRGLAAAPVVPERCPSCGRCSVGLAPIHRILPNIPLEGIVGEDAPVSAPVALEAVAS
jgi:hypothetical protein